MTIYDSPWVLNDDLWLFMKPMIYDKRFMIGLWSPAWSLNKALYFGWVALGETWSLSLEKNAIVTF